MACYIVYYECREKIVHKGKPKQEEYPGSSFAEGPFKNKAAAMRRLARMGR